MSELGVYIGEKLRNMGYKDLKEAAKQNGLDTSDYETLRRTVNEHHMPNIKFLKRISEKFKLDPSLLFLLSFQARIAKELGIDVTEAARYTKFYEAHKKLLSAREGDLRKIVAKASMAPPEKFNIFVKVARDILE